MFFVNVFCPLENEKNAGVGGVPNELFSVPIIIITNLVSSCIDNELVVVSIPTDLSLIIMILFFFDCLHRFQLVCLTPCAGHQSSG